MVGDDVWGSAYKENLKSMNVDVSHVLLTKNVTTGIAQISVAENGDNHIIIVTGANHKLSKKDIIFKKNYLNSAKILILQMEIPVEIIIHCLNIYKGVSILNAAPAMENPDNLLFTLPTIFCVNETEASTFTGRSVNNVREAKAAVDVLLKKGCNSVILTLGQEGAIYASRVSPKPVQIYAPKVNAIDTTGAGDEFVGSLAYILTYRPDIKIEHAIEVANHLAAFSVTKYGTQQAFLNSDDLENLLRKMKLH